MAALHAEKLSPIEAIKTLMKAYDLSLGEAKSVVTAYPKWADTTARAAELHDALIIQSDDDT